MAKLLYDESTFLPLYTDMNVSVMQKNVHDTARFQIDGLSADWYPGKAWLSK